MAPATTGHDPFDPEQRPTQATAWTVAQDHIAWLKDNHVSPRRALELIGAAPRSLPGRLPNWGDVTQAYATTWWRLETPRTTQPWPRLRDNRA